MAVWAAALVISCGLLALPLVAFAASAVTIQNSAFTPPTTSVKVGDTVTWTNRDAFSHTATSDTGAWDTSVIAAGTSKSIMFMGAGTFAYHCSIHPFMHGTVVVQGAATPPPPPPPTAPSPTPVRTVPPTIAPTSQPTAEATEAASASPTAAPSASPSPSAAATATVTASPSPSAVAVQVTPVPAAGGGGLGPTLIAAAAVAVVALGAIAVFLARRS